VPAMVGLAGSKILAATNLKGDRNRQMAEAESLLRRGLVRDKTDFAAYFYLGILQNLQSNIPAALQAYDHAIELNPSFAPAHVYRGRVLIRLSKYDEALQSIEYAVRLAGSAVHGWHLWRGIAELELGWDQSAEDSFSRALAALPGNPYVQAAMAGFRALKGERELAAIHVGELRRMTPSMDNQMRLVEFNKGADNRPLPNRLGVGLRRALDEHPDLLESQARAALKHQQN
jgi:tetratricopeptide (TPR) repeat protein